MITLVIACLTISVPNDGLQQIMSNMITHKKTNINRTRMWANAQRDGHPAEYRWHPLFNTAKFC